MVLPSAPPAGGACSVCVRPCALACPCCALPVCAPCLPLHRGPTGCVGWRAARVEGVGRVLVAARALATWEAVLVDTPLALAEAGQGGPANPAMGVIRSQATDKN